VIFIDLRSPVARLSSATESIHPALRGLRLPSSVAIYALCAVRSTNDPERIQFPNLLEWSDSVAPTVRAVVLDLGDLDALSPEAAFELNAAVERLWLQGRRLVLTGLAVSRVSQLLGGVGGSAMGAVVLCPDLELAVARALVLAGEVRPWVANPPAS
ncbi:MAG: hypothetical protein ACT4PL_01325, partial [Phycisphaerales bacterium]